MQAASGWITLFAFTGALWITASGALWGRRREFRGGGALAVQFFSVGGWTIAYGVSLGLDTDSAIAVKNVAQALVFIAPGALLVFAARFTHTAPWMDPHGPRVVAAFCLTFAVLAVTNLNGWFLPQGRSPIDGTVRNPGPVYLAALFVCTLWMLAATVWLLRYAAATRWVRRHESVAISIGAITLWVGSALTAVHVFPFGVDATTLAYVIVESCLAFAVLMDRGMELMRTWPTELVDTYDDGFMLIDDEGTLLHGNDAGLSIFEATVDFMRGRSIYLVLGSGPEVEQMVTEHRGDFSGSVMVGGRSKPVSVSAHPVTDVQGRSLGTALRVRDETATFIDPLTGIGNRRFFFERAQQVLHDSSATPERAVSVAIIDLDHLKHINDGGGHARGDAALSRLGRLLGALAPGTWITGRLGGDEFAFVAPAATQADAVQVLEGIRSGLAVDEATWTISAGVALMRPDEDLLMTLARADDALLRAKREGRNTTRIAEALERAAQ